jgi:hypothetical protein
VSITNQGRATLNNLDKRPLLIAAAAFAAAFILYWPTLNLPLLFDDLLHIRLVKNLDFFTVWLPSEDFGFYRPFVFLPFLIIKAIFGHYPAPLLHGLTVAQHSLNAALLALLAWRLWHSPGRSLTAGLLLAVYPFAYQAVAFYGNAIYPTAAGLILLALHTYLNAIQNREGSKKWFIVTAVLFFIGLLSHETIVLFGPLAFLVHWTTLDKLWPKSASDVRLLARQLWPAIIFVALGLLYILLYQLLPTGSGPGLDAGGNALWPKTLYLLQTAVYPVAWLAHRLPTISANGIILAGLALMLLLSVLSARRPTNRLGLLLGWLWWALASILIGINLPTYYIEHGARLVYLGGVGIILVWVILLDWLFLRPKIGPILWTAVLLFVFVSSAGFVRGRLAAFTAIASPLNTIEQVTVEKPEDEGILLVNLPAWMSPVRNTYATGVEYVTLMGVHLFAEELTEENLLRNHPVLAVAVPELLTDPGYPYGIHNQANLETIPADWAAAGSHIFVTDYTESGPVTSYTGHLSPAPDNLPALASFNPYILTSASAVYCNNTITVNLTWQIDSQAPSPDPQAPTRSIFVQALDENGRLIAQADGPPLGLRPDHLVMPSGWKIIDRRTMNIDQTQPQQLLLGLYDNVTGERYTAVDSEGRPLPDNALSLPIPPC